MKLIYIANIRLPTEKAHGIQIMEMCAAFAGCGMEVELVVARRFNLIKDDPFIYHDIKKNFTICKLLCLDLIGLGKFGFIIEVVSFSLSAAIYSLTRKDSIFYTRDASVALFLKLLGKKVAWEGHMGQTNFVIKILIFLKVPMVMITKSLLELYISLGVLPEQIIVASDGVDLERFDVDISKEAARKKLGLSLDKKIVLYKGALFAWKGAGDIARAAENFVNENIIFVFIGGTEKDVASFKNDFGGRENILILGNRPRTETPIYQKAADVLVIPNSAKNDISNLYTSPMKLFGYMAGGVPIVASDIPSLREVLSERNAILVPADNPDALGAGIKKLLEDGELSEKLAKQALVDVREYTWEKRARKIINFIKK